MRAFAFALALAPLPSLAFEMPEDEAAAQFVASNVIAIFYHELGHALIDVLALPVLGKEEDAADTLSAILTHHIWDEESTTQIVYDTAFAYSAYAAEGEAEGWDLSYADTHSLELQRYYGLVCLYYGANPEMREDEALELDLPEDRAVTCEEEFTLADDSWGVMLEGLEPGADTKGLRLVDADPTKDPIAAILAEEITTLNDSYGLPAEIAVKVEPCGEANAFYDPELTTITFCTEYAEDLLRLYTAFE